MHSERSGPRERLLPGWGTTMLSTPRVPPAHPAPPFPASPRGDGSPALRSPAALESPKETQRQTTAQKKNIMCTFPTLHSSKKHTFSHYSCTSTGSTKQVTVHAHSFSFQRCHHPDLFNVSNLKELSRAACHRFEKTDPPPHRRSHQKALNVFA